MTEQRGLIELVGGGVGVVVDVSGGTPVVVHWGRPVGDVSLIAALVERPVANGVLDVVAPLAVLPEHGSGYLGRPGIEGRRDDGSDWAPRFTTTAVDHDAHHDPGRGSLRVASSDETAGLTLVVDLAVGSEGLLTASATLTNDGTDDYHLDALRITLPLPGHATETLTFTGRWALELQPVRQPWPSGSRSVEGRTGRTSHDRVPLAFAGTASFGEDDGEVWGVHLGWSGSSAVHFDANADGRRSVQAGELLQPGEVVLAPGASYTSPVVYGAWSDHGLNGASAAFHAHLRAQPNHPRTPRPVTLNTWEAIYFAHSFDLVARLADRAAAVGIERFVLDDGWFHLRRDDHAGLGDWWVDPAVWPDGLGPIVDHVTALGMQFGLWFEPEMVNPESDLYRAHPDWVLTDDRYEPVLGRHQLVLDLHRPEVVDYLFEKIDAVLAAHDIGYVKWDMNRDLVHASHDRRAAVHQQTLGLYRLLDRVRTAHPDVEIESCSSGGGRTDFGILRWTSRFWTSDSNDAFDRQHIQRSFSYLFPPELMGAHVGPPRAHTTGRTHSLAFRAATAFFGHFGVEWNVLDLDDRELAQLADVIALHKRFRALLHSGRARRIDHPNPAVIAHSVVRADQREALVSYALVGSPRSLTCEPVRVVGLLDDVRYRVEVLPIAGGLRGAVRRQPAWVTDGLAATGRQVATIGVQPPVLHAESAMVLHIRAEGDPS